MTYPRGTPIEERAVARKTKDELIEEARSLDLAVDEDENYNVLAQRVSAARDAQERAQEEPEPAEEDESPDFEHARVCRNCGRPAVTTDDAGGKANPIDFCERHAPS